MKVHMLFVAMAILAGCASRIPQNIRQEPTPNLTLSEVLARTDAVKNRPVRWGGSILTIVNHLNDTEIEILAKELDSSGKPLDRDDTLGRFLARVDGFVDPAVYSQGRMLTIYGLVDSVVTREIGEKPYAYPVIQIQTHYLWPKDSEIAYPDYYPYGFGLYGPYGYYPYGYRYGFRRR